MSDFMQDLMAAIVIVFGSLILFGYADYVPTKAGCESKYVRLLAFTDAECSEVAK